MTRIKTILAVFLSLAVAAAACGDGASETASTFPEPAAADSVSTAPQSSMTSPSTTAVASDETSGDMTAVTTIDDSPVSSDAMTLTFGSSECLYEGPSVISPGQANLTFVNNSGATGAVNVIELLDDKTWADLVDYAGEQPSSKHAPSWTRSVRQWRPILSGDTLLWDEKLTPGIYAVVCANISPLAVWLGSSFEVEG